MIKVSKNKNSTPTKLIYKNQEKVSNVEIAESLNDFFVNIGSSVESKIPQSKNNFQSSLGIPNSKNIFLEPCTPAEILKIIENMKSTKASGPNNISTNLLIEFSQYLVYPRHLSSISRLRKAHSQASTKKSTSVFIKRMKRTNVLTTDLSHFFQILVKSSSELCTTA